MFLEQLLMTNASYPSQLQQRWNFLGLSYFLFSRKLHPFHHFARGW